MFWRFLRDVVEHADRWVAGPLLFLAIATWAVPPLLPRFGSNLDLQAPAIQTVLSGFLASLAFFVGAYRAWLAAVQREQAVESRLAAALSEAADRSPRVESAKMWFTGHPDASPNTPGQVVWQLDICNRGDDPITLRSPTVTWEMPSKVFGLPGVVQMQARVSGPSSRRLELPELRVEGHRCTDSLMVRIEAPFEFNNPNRLATVLRNMTSFRVELKFPVVGSPHSIVVARTADFTQFTEAVLQYWRESGRNDALTIYEKSFGA